MWADASNIRATELERAAKMYAAWEESTAPQREAAELALAELGRRKPEAKPSQPEAAVAPSGASARGTTGPESEAYSSGPELEVPAAEPGDLDVDAVAGDLHAAVGQLPELDTSTVGPATETRLEELAEREAAQDRGGGGRGPAGGQP